MGDNGEGWLMPHKPKNPDCETKDHVVFKEGGKAFEVFYSSECAENRKEYDWKLDENQIILSKSDVSKPMLLHKVDGDQLILGLRPRDRKSTRLNSSHVRISYAVFCLKKK